VPLDVQVGEIAPPPPPVPTSSGQTSRLRFERSDLLIVTANNMLNQARLLEAEQIYLSIISREPDNFQAYVGMAIARERLGDVEGGVEYFDKALSMMPNSLTVISGAIFNHDRRSETTMAEAYQWRRRYNDLVKRPVRPHLNTKAPDRKLKVGYVSGDFRHHSAAVVFGPVLLMHDRAQFDVYAYASSRANDWMTEKLRAAIPNWREVVDWSDEHLEQQIRADGIDILVDLSGHSAGNRLPVFARKPAPVQVTAWGYITGTGLDAMDYLFADADTILPDEEQWYSEKIVRLPRIVTYWAADPALVGAVQPLPAIRNGHLTFGVFNRLGKLKREVVGIWSRILDAIPDARLIIKAPGLDDQRSREWLQGLFEEHSADLARIQFRGITDHTTHMLAFNEVDVCLDPWPDSGGVSTLESMWMGVPVITMPYRQIASRLTTAFNREVGLPWLIASSPDEYVERAVQLNSQRVELAGIRGLLRDVMSCSYLGDQERYTRACEEEYRKMWQTWCAEQTGLPNLRVVS